MIGYMDIKKIDELKKLAKGQNPAYNIAMDKKSLTKWTRGYLVWRQNYASGYSSL